MPLYRKMKSPLGYQNLTNSSLDSYGVDHSAFTTRDELEYQFARQERENLLMDQEQQNGVTDNFTQYGTNFWGTPQENNYGFGSSNISENIERLQKTFMTPPIQPVVEEPQATGSLFDTPVGYQSLLSNDENLSSNSMSSMRDLSADNSNSSYPKYWETPEEGEEVYKTVLSNEGYKEFKFQNIWEYIDSAKRAYDYITKEKDLLSKNKNLTDKFKHAYLNCKGAQMGKGGSDMAAVLSYGKEFKDLLTGQNKLSESIADNYANLSGRLVGSNNPEADCEALLEKYIKKYY